MPTVDTNLSPDYGSGQQSNPLGMVSTVMWLRNLQLEQQQRQQQLFLFNQQLQARQRFGQIVATSPDLETGLANAAKDPQVAPYAGEWVGQYRSSLLADQQFQNERQHGAMEGVAAVKGAIGAGMGDQSLIPAAVSATLRGLSPYAQSRAAAAAGDLTTALTANLPSDPAQAQAAARQRAVALSGAMPDQIHAILGTGGVRNVGDKIVSGTEAPVQGLGTTPGGAFTSSNAITAGSPPSVEKVPGGMPYVQPGATGGATLEGNQLGAPAASAAPNPFGPMPSAWGASPIPSGGTGVGTGVSPQAGATAPNPKPAPSTEIAGDGKPLFADTSKIASTPFSLLNQGTNLNPAEAAQNDAIIHQFTTEHLPAMQRAQTGLAQASEIDADLDQLHKAGGWQTPGSFGNLRNSLAKMVNTFETATGAKVDFDPASVASYEQLNKDTRRMGLSLTSTNLGEGHQAAQTIDSNTQAVPSVDNTYLGAKLVNASIKAQFQYTRDMYDYVNTVANQNHGDIRSAYDDFAKEHPASDYVNNVLNQFGLVHTPKGVGFADPKSLENAYRSGLVSQTEAKAIASEQFGWKGQ